MRVLYGCLVAVFAGCWPAVVHAGEEDVSACLEALELHSSRSAASRVGDKPVWTPRLFSPNTVEWNGIYCAIGSAGVVGLALGDTVLIRDGFSGSESKQLYDRLRARLAEVKTELQDRARQLERELDDAETALRQPRPDLVFIRNQFERQALIALGAGRPDADDAAALAPVYPDEGEAVAAERSESSAHPEPQQNAVDHEAIARAKEAYGTGDFETALPGLRQAAENGDVEAQYTLAVLYDAGADGVPIDRAEAARFFGWLRRQGISRLSFY